MRPFKTLPEFEHLTPNQLESVHDLLREKSYKEVQDELWCSFQIQLSINKLFRYYKRLETADMLSATEEAHVTVQDLLDLSNGKPVHWDPAGLEAVKKSAFELAISEKTKPSLLKDLFRIFTYEDNRALRERQQQLRERTQTFRENQFAAKNKRKMTVAEQDVVVREIFGLRPIPRPTSSAPGRTPVSGVSEGVSPSFVPSTAPPLNHDPDPTGTLTEERPFSP